MTSVLHSFSRWLPRTQTWNYTQIRYLPADVRSHVVCEATENLAEFPIERLHAPGIEPWPRRLAERVLRRLGLRAQRGYVRAVLRRVRADGVHSHFGSIGWQDAAALRGLGAFHVVTFYGADVTYLPQRDPRWRERYARLFASVDRVLCEGPHMAGRIRDLGCDGGKIAVLHLGVAVDEIAFRPRRRAPGEPLRVLVAASFVEKKGIPLGIEALGRLRARTDVELTILGDELADARSRGQRERIERALDASGLAASTRRLGFRPHAEFFEEAERCHLFMAPSLTASDGDTEGGAPVSLIEAQASGMPVVSTRHCDIPEVVLDGRSGLLAAEGDLDDLSACLERLALHPERWEAMALAGRRHVEREFDARTQAGRLAAVYRDLVRHRERGRKGQAEPGEATVRPGR